MKRLFSLAATLSTALLLLFPGVAFADDSFLVGDWSTSSGDASFTFYADGTCVSDFGLWPEQGAWKAQDTGGAAFPIEIDGSSVLWLMQLAYGGVDESYHFEVLKCNDDNFFLVQVYGEYDAWTSKCKLPLTRVGAKADFTLPPEEGQSEAAEASVSEDPANAVVSKPFQFSEKAKVDINWGWNLFDKSASEYDHNLAMAAVTLSQNTYYGQGKLEERLSDFGFENPSSENYEGDFWGDWEEARPAYTFASKQVTLHGENMVIVAVVVRGTNDVGDWRANLASVQDGFAAPTKYVFGKLENYLGSLKLENGEAANQDNMIFLVTGHSQGGAVAGALASLIENGYGERSRIFAYTFAAANYYTSSNRRSLTNVHNIVNVRDVVPYVPGRYSKNGHVWHYNSANGKYQSYFDKVYGAENWHAGWAGDEHELSTYLAMMLCDLPYDMNSGSVNPYSLTSVHCPVDIAVYSPDGVLMGATKGEDVTIEETSTVLVMVDGDEKYVFAPPGEPYMVKITGTGSGEMTVAQQSIDPDTGDIVSGKSFENVAVEEGRQFTLAVSGEAQVDDVSLETADSGEQQGSAGAGQSDAGQGDSGFQWWQILLIVVGVVVLAFVILLVIGTVKNTRKQNKRKKKASKKRKRK